MDKLVEIAQKGCTQDEAALGFLGKSAGSVSTALKELIDYISHGMGQGGGHYDEVCEAILAAHEDFFSSVPNAGQMVKQAQGLAQATSELIKALKVSVVVVVVVSVPGPIETIVLCPVLDTKFNILS